MKPVAVIAGVAVAAALAGLGWWALRATPATQQAAAVAAAAAPAPAAAPRVTALPPSTAPLPAQDTPLRLVFDDLRRRAGNGDARAACRLAAELEQCERVRLQLAQFDDMTGQQQRMLEGMDPARRARMQESLQRTALVRGQQLLQDSERCDGVPAMSPGQRAALWRDAALGGSLPALAQYAVGNAFRTRDTLQVLPQLQTYRNEAEALALQAAERGSLKATVALAGAYSPQRDTGRRTYLAQVVTPDPSKSLALYLRAQQALASTQPAQAAQAQPPMQRFRAAALQRNIDWLRGNMSDAQVAQADALARQWQQDWAAAAPEEGEVAFSPDGGVPDVAPKLCGD
ncbi:hypothetical protein [Pseudoxanthomonas sp. X-1]|uniref:hypothetical protein n=1 Tax=Pseudoxanthomonas sp. X-1 TaxID=2571115 RepID=UPI001486B879|nr:hypothetical protein [Pseudoxanthomonas sp. X-1]UAY74962.1 hypothetical protein LAJ50_01400 [Pseudoxanthomonas sp. X-1]